MESSLSTLPPILLRNTGLVNRCRLYNSISLSFVAAGGLAQHCTHAVVFAQLFADGADRGVHAFVVQIRSQTDGSLMPGVHVMDIGYKTGNGSETVSGLG